MLKRDPKFIAKEPVEEEALSDIKVVRIMLSKFLLQFWKYNTRNPLFSYRIIS